jgi:RNA recognition motif-containing protein
MLNIFVENLTVSTTEQALRAAFEAFGQVLSVKVVSDRDTGVPRGLAFVEMTSDKEAQAAIAGLNGKMIDDRVIHVNEARPKQIEGTTVRRAMRSHRKHRY